MSAADFQWDDSLKNQQHEKGDDSPRADQPGERSLLSTLGNAAVQRLLRSDLRRQEAGGGAVDDPVARAIQAKRGSGQGLDSATRRELEPAFGHDFSDVRIHTDAEADTLNKAVSAEAFTTGNDIFFRSGGYNPGSPDGRKLLTHELTHVVQQSGSATTSDMTVSSPDDASERQAAEIADTMTASAPAASAQSVARAEDLEDEKLAESQVARAAAEAEEMVPPAQGTVEEEEMPPPGQVAMAAEEEEELEPPGQAGIEEEEELKPPPSQSAGLDAETALEGAPV